MPEILDKYDFSHSRKRGRWNWDQILDGKIRRWEADDIPASFASQVKTNASKLGIEVQVATEEDGSVVVQAIG